jgi:DNA-binding transcriptional LysR family regulator
MDWQNQDLNDLMYFSQIVDHGGFSAAERVLGVSKSRLSRRLSDLEAKLGVRLLQRSTRRLALTEAGRVFYAHCSAMLGEARAAFDTVSQLRAAPRGTVRVSCPVTVSHMMLSPMLPQFLLQYPEVSIDVQVTNRIVDLYEDGIDVALRVRSVPPRSENVIVRPLMTTHQLLVAAPSLLKRLGRPESVDDLGRFETLDLPVEDGRHVFHLEGPNGERRDIAHTPRLVTADIGSIFAALKSGIGIAVLPEMNFAPAMADGSLAPVLPGWSSPKPNFYAVFLSRQGLSPAVRVFVDFLVEAFRNNDLPKCPRNENGEVDESLMNERERALYHEQLAALAKPAKVDESETKEVTQSVTRGANRSAGRKVVHRAAG